MQLDMVYGLLALKIRKRLTRSEINSFKDLLNYAREIEQSFYESAFRKQERNTNQDGMQIKKLRPRCEHCKKFGHLKNECRQLEKENNTQELSKSTSTRSKPECYGCGTLGYYRWNCPKCKEKSDVKTNFFECSRLSLKNESSCDAPILPLEVKGAKGIGLADSGSKWNIAGHTLYKVLQDKVVKFETMDTVVTLADRIPKDKKLLVTDVDVKIKDKMTPTSFVIMPYLTQNHTLLGRQFLKKANIGLVMLFGLIMYISIFKAEIGSKLRPQSQLQPPAFYYWYGYSFLLYVSGLVTTQLAGISSIFLFIYKVQYEWQRKHLEDMKRGKARNPITFTHYDPSMFYPCRRHPQAYINSNSAIHFPASYPTPVLHQKRYFFSKEPLQESPCSVHRPRSHSNSLKDVSNFYDFPPPPTISYQFDEHFGR
ncbi:hypothetical protein Zmor_023995 [Zophobas morio]|uniref:CCHC-type domain-containing protein n=1 Tax=Zophobas morio TaxID=2755281 RepID=A0AA38I114_9CUCU|nr:hypothetical protein Zmor_023995 [Zophobas morio]